MSDDIVTRLRELGRYVNTEGGRWFEPITTEAADEIERLRALVEHLSAQVRLQQKANDKAWEAYEQAVRGD